MSQEKKAKRSDFLTALVKSLNQTEKRYFRITNKIATFNDKKTNSYTQLFDIIESTDFPELDEELIKKRYLSEGNKNYNETKYYLYNFLLKCLQSYYTDGDATLIAQWQLNNIKLLFQRGLYPNAFSYLRKTKTYIEELDELSSTLEISLLEQRYFEVNLDTMDMESANEKQLLSIRENLQKIDQQVYINYLLKKIRIIYRQFGPNPDENALAQMEAILNDPEIKDFEKIRSFLSKCYYFDILAMYYIITADKQKTLQNQFNIISFFEENPKKLQANNYHYISAHLNLSLAQRNMGLLEDSRKTLNKVRDFIEGKANIKNKFSFLYLASVWFEMNLCYQMGRFGDAAELAVKLENDFMDYIEIRNDLKYEIFFALAYTYFGSEKNKKAIMYLTKIINDIKLKNISTALKAETWTLYLCLQLNLENYDIAEKLLKTIGKKNDISLITNPLHKKFINHIRKKIGKVSNKAEFQNLLISFKTENEDLYTTALHLNFTELDEVMNIAIWIESVITKQDYSKLVSKNYIDFIAKNISYKKGLSKSLL